jgi:hypothetical protein
VAPHRIAVIPGDGIGKEVVPPAQRVLEEVGRQHGFSFAWTELDWSCERYARTGAMMPDDGIDQLREHDQVLLGAVGFPGVPDHVSLWGLLIPIRRAFRQYVNLRPVKLLRGMTSPLRGVEAIDMLVVRENSEGEYSEMGGRFGRGTPGEFAVQESVFTRVGVRAGDALRPRPRRVALRAPRVGDEVQRDHPHDAVLGRGRPRAGGGPARRRAVGVPRRRARGDVRPRPRAASTSSSRPTCSATSSPTSAGR